MRKATIKERNHLWCALHQARPGGAFIYPGHRFEPAAREFEAEGLVTIQEPGILESGVRQDAMRVQLIEPRA